jgi:hypothetical protein
MSLARDATFEPVLSPSAVIVRQIPGDMLQYIRPSAHRSADHWTRFCMGGVDLGPCRTREPGSTRTKVDHLGLRGGATPTRASTSDALRHSNEPEHQKAPGILTESVSRPTIRLSVLHQRQDLHKALADLALLALRNADDVVGPSSRVDCVNSAGHTTLSRRLASIEAPQGDPNHSSFHDARFTTAGEGWSARRRELFLPRSTGRGSRCSRNCR